MNSEEAYLVFKDLVGQGVPSGSGRVRLITAMDQAYETSKSNFPAKHLLSILDQVADIEKMSEAHKKQIQDLYFYWT